MQSNVCVNNREHTWVVHKFTEIQRDVTCSKQKFKKDRKMNKKKIKEQKKKQSNLELEQRWIDFAFLFVVVGYLI